MKKTLLALIILSAVSFHSCKDDEDPTPNTNTQSQAVCDSLDITYTNHIKSVVDQSCNVVYCHAASAGGFKLGTYQEVKTAAERSNFLGAIKHGEDFVNMPLGQDQLSDALIQQFECWEKNGFKEN